MNRVLTSSKTRAILVPILILLIFGALLVSTILKQEQQLPTKGWSRAINFKTTMASSDYPYVQEKNGDYFLYTKDKTKVNELVLNSNFEALKQANLPVKVPSFSPLWSDGKRVVFLDKHQLQVVLNGKTKVIDQNVDGMTTEGNEHVLYWKSNQLYEYLPSTDAIKQLAKTPYPIDTVSTKRGSQALLIKSQVIKTKYVYLGVVLQQNSDTYHPLERFNQPYNATLEDFDFATHQDKMYVVYAKFGSTSGGMERVDYLSTYNIQNFKKIGKEQILNIKNVQTGLSFSNEPGPTHCRIYWKDGGPILLFEEDSFLFHGEEAQNIFLAKPEKQAGNWLASPITSTVAPSGNPMLLNKNTVVWNDLFRNQFTLRLASQNPSIIQKSYALSRTDWSQATNRALINLTISILMFGFALLWAIPTSLFIVVMFMGFMTKMERNPYWVKGVGIGLFLVTQLIYIKGLFGPTFERFAPHFLKFSGNSIVIPVIVMGVAWGLTEWIKNKEWGNALFIFYCLFLDVLMLGFLIGPYTL